MSWSAIAVVAVLATVLGFAVRVAIIYGVNRMIESASAEADRMADKWRAAGLLPARITDDQEGRPSTP